MQIHTVVLTLCGQLGESEGACQSVKGMQVQGIVFRVRRAHFILFLGGDRKLIQNLIGGTHSS